MVIFIEKQLKLQAKIKPYNLTYFITFLAIATFAVHKYVPAHRKRYKMFYIRDFIR